MQSTLKQRFNARRYDRPDEQLALVQGTMADYHALKQYHYLAKRPATATRILALRHTAHTAATRFRHEPPAHQTAAVLVESLPSLACRMRNVALNDRYDKGLTAKQQAALLNKEVRVISRVVVHPCWRGLGLAVRLVRAALEQPTTIYTEALAAMGKINPFFARAGMTAYPRPPLACDSRLIEAMQAINLQPRDLALIEQTKQTIDALAPPTRTWFKKELHRWYRQNGGRSSTHSKQTRDHLLAARQRLLCQPIYYLKDNRDMVAGDWWLANQHSVLTAKG